MCMYKYLLAPDKPAQRAQAGAACGTLEQQHIFVKPGTSGLNVLCDALLDNSCARATSTVGHTAYRVLNWDYSRTGGDGKYVRPYNAGDTAWLGQTLTYTSPHYSRYDAYWRHTGAENVIATVPTLYMSTQAMFADGTAAPAISAGKRFPMARSSHGGGRDQLGGKAHNRSLTLLLGSAPCKLQPQTAASSEPARRLFAFTRAQAHRDNGGH